MTFMPSLTYLCVTLGLSASAWLSLLHPTARGWALLIFALTVASVALERVATMEAAQAVPDQDLSRVERAGIRALVVGAGAVGRQLAETLEASGHYQVVGFVDDHGEIAPDTRWQILGGRESTAAIVQEYAVAEVFLAYAPTWQQRLAEDLAADFPHVGVQVVPSHYEAMLHTSSVRSLGDIAVVHLNADAMRLYDLTKRLFDLSVAVTGLVLLTPFMLLVAILIKLTSRGPVIFYQERIGRFGRPFRVYKFRTMRQNAEADTGPMLSPGKKDSRLTPVGRWLRLFRIDEIPQLWNVLRAEMSLVGPRPERPCFVKRFEAMVPSYARRHQVRPGITGLAQICAGYHTDARDKLRFDLIYVSHRSFWLDLSILLRTVLVVLSPDRK